MAKSKFLPLQDIDGDKLIDACKEVMVVEEEVPCPECTPNLAAIIPNWRKRTLYEPFLNGKNCKYQITVTTDETTIGDLECTDDNLETEERAEYTVTPLDIELQDLASAEALKELFVKYEDTAIVALLQVYGKDDSEESIKIVREAPIEHTDYWLPPHHKSHLKLLYSVPSAIIDSLTDAPPEEVDEVDEEEEKVTDIVVTYEAKNINSLLLKTRINMNLFGRYLMILRAVENSNILFVEGETVFNLKDYGDMGARGTSILSLVVPQLDACLNKYGYSIPKPGPIGFFDGKTAVTEITFTFTPAYRLKRITFFTENCNNIPISWYEAGGKLDSLKAGSAWADRTAMAYFTQLREMERDLTSRTPPLWTDFIVKYTFPPVFISNTTSDDETELNCIGEALSNEGKQLGQDLLDEAFSIGDAIAYKFHEQTCKKSLSEQTAEDIELGITRDPSGTNNQGNIYAMAQEQEYKTLETSSPSFESYCDRIVNFGMETRNMSPEDRLKELWSEGFDDIKLCGLFDTFIQAMTSLFSGLTLEDAVGAVTESGLRGMSIVNFGHLYSGIPANEQIEIEQLALKKLEEGEVFDDELINQQISDAIGAGVSLVRPWEDENLTEEEKTETPSAYGTSSGDVEIAYQPARRTLAQRYDITSGGAESQFSTRVAMEVYIQAFLEVYQDNLLGLLDELNKFPGSQLIANTILAVDCPVVPFENPGIPDFMHNNELPNPFCRDISEISWPQISNPYAWIPELSDKMGPLFEALKDSIQLVIIEVLTQLMIKVCEIVGDTISNAIESTGNLESSLATAANNNMLIDLIKESICGAGADDETVNNTVVDVISSLGVGGAALADKEQTLTFAKDISSCLTQGELYDAFLGNLSNDGLTIIDNLTEHEHPDFRSALPHKIAIASFFKNMGNLMPAKFRENLRDYADQLPENDTTPANPTICADPALLEQFCELRADLLCGRATGGQAKEMCDGLQKQTKDDLKDLSAIMQNLDAFLESNMPPLVSDPGCDNGLLPYEPKEIIASVNAGLNGDLEVLKMNFLIDMLGTGPMPSDWGMLNMMLSDTMGNPLTAHMINVAFKRNSVHPYVDFYGTWAPDQVLMLAMSALNPLYAVMAAPHMLQLQRGAFPTKVAAWLQNGINQIGAIPSIGRKEISLDSDPGIGMNINLNNEYTGSVSWEKSLKELGIFPESFNTNVDLVAIPDLGYNVEMEPVIDEESNHIHGVEFTAKGRKADPDVTLSFSDNAKGLAGMSAMTQPDVAASPPQSAYSYGFDIYSYFGDLIEKEPGAGEYTFSTTEPVGVNRPDDNVRIKINERLNLAANVTAFLEASESPHTKLLDSAMGGDETMTETLEGILDGTTGMGIINEKLESLFDAGAAALFGQEEYNVLETLKYEFIATDNTFDVVGEEFLSNYPDFLKSFQSKAVYDPQTILLSEMLKKENGAGPEENVAKTFRSDFIQKTLDTFFRTVADVDAKGKSSWNYGATFDALTSEDFYYGITNPDTGLFVPYFEANQEINEADEPYREKDMVLGISLNQHNTLLAGGTMDDVRVLYLNPATHGGNYIRPSFYVRPIESEGWLGLVDGFFPEVSPCEPRDTDLVDFEQIQEKINEIYPNLTEDERLKTDTPCVVELPYNRILRRAGKAGMIGLITAAIRIYVCAHFIKGFPTFTKFAPRYPAVLSSVYASYIIEVMESHFKDAQPPLWELFNVFKDEEFWYAFLEQSVQMYALLVDSGDIQDPPPAVLDALFRLNDLQADYEYPFKDDLQVAKETGDAGAYQTLGAYRLDKNLEAVRATEEDAKIVLKELVNEQINFMADKFMHNMDKLGWHTEVHDMAYYLLEEMTVDSQLTLNKAINPDGSYMTNYSDNIGTETKDASGAPKYYYTYGGEFVVEEDRDRTGLTAGTEYTGYYHVVLDENGNLRWMAGQQHTEEAHDILRPLVYQISVPIGDVPELNSVSTGDASPDKPFILEKYISIDGARQNPTTAYDMIRSDSTGNISDVYPGTLKIVNDESGNPVGLSGQLGVRYGLLFSIVIGGTKYEVTSVELDALDLQFNEFSNLEGDSKLLLCLINFLKNDEKFKLMSEYILPLNKLIGLTAIYNDMGILPSIGEVTADRNQTFWNIINPNPLKSTVALLKTFDYSYKPGLQVTVNKEELLGPGGEPMMETIPALEIERPSPFPWSAGTVPVEISPETLVPIEIITGATLEQLPNAKDGAWAAFQDRLPETTFNPLAGFGVVEYDFWSQEILRNSRARIKKLFMTYYYSKNLDLAFVIPNVGDLLKKELRALLRPSPGLRQIPWWMRGRLKTIPFDADGNVCESEQ